jgi:hypothetical protein
MTDIRTPPSLKWLLSRRSRLLGEISKLQQAIPRRRESLGKEIARLERELQALQCTQSGHLPEEQLLKVLESDLTAIDGALMQHQVQIDLDLVPTIRSQDAERYLDHGAMTRLIYQYLKNVFPRAISTSEIAVFIASATCLDLEPEQFNEFRYRIRRRLKNLAYEKKLHEPITPVQIWKVVGDCYQLSR